MLCTNDKRTDSEILVSGLKAEEAQFSLGLDITIVKCIQQLSFLFLLTEKVMGPGKKKKDSEETFAKWDSNQMWGENSLNSLLIYPGFTVLICFCRREHLWWLKDPFSTVFIRSETDRFVFR